MAEISLQGPSVGALVRQRVARAVTQHVRMHLEGKFGLDSGPLDQLGKANGRKRRTALRTGLA